MGLLDHFLRNKDERNQKAFGDGVRDRDKAGFADKVIHEAGDFIYRLIPHPKPSKESQSYEAGWHERAEGKVKWKKREKGRNRDKGLRVQATSSSDSSGSFLGCLFVVAILVGLGFLVINNWPNKGPQLQPRKVVNERAKPLRNSHSKPKESKSPKPFPDMGPVREPSPYVSTDYDSNPRPKRSVCQAQLDRNRVGPECEWYANEIRQLEKK